MKSPSGHALDVRRRIIRCWRPYPASSVLFRPRPGGGRIAGGEGLLVGFVQFVTVIIGDLVGLRGHIVVSHANTPLSGPQFCSHAPALPPIRSRPIRRRAEFGRAVLASAAVVHLGGGASIPRLAQAAATS